MLLGLLKMRVRREDVGWRPETKESGKEGIQVTGSCELCGSPAEGRVSTLCNRCEREVERWMSMMPSNHQGIRRAE